MSHIHTYSARASTKTGHVRHSRPNRQEYRRSDVPSKDGGHFAATTSGEICVALPLNIMTARNKITKREAQVRYVFPAGQVERAEDWRWSDPLQVA